jgi:hypothetical protein
MSYTRKTWAPGDVPLASDFNNWEGQYAAVFDSTAKAPTADWFWSSSKVFGFSDGYFARTAANAIKFWNGSTLGTLAAGTLSDSVGSLASVRGGALGLSGQAALDFVYALNSGQLARKAAGSALQYPRINAAGTDWEFATLASNKDVCNGRLTLESGVPISTSNQSGKTTLYFSPFGGNQIGLYDGSVWSVLSFSELSLSLSGYTASKPYDIFAYNNAGSVALESLVWTNTTTRATALVLQDGVYVKSGATTRRYLGSILINASGGQCDDTLSAPSVWNLYNRRERPVGVSDSTSSWTWATPGGVFRASRNTTANSVDVFVGIAGLSRIRLVASSMGLLDDGNGVLGVGIGIDSSTTNSAQLSQTVSVGSSVNTMMPTIATYDGYPAIGKRQFRWLEYGNSFSGTGTATLYGATSGGRNVGMTGVLER